MKRPEIKDLIMRSLSEEENQGDIQGKLEEAGVTYSFSDDFPDKVLDRIFSTGTAINREMEFVKSWNLAFYRIALTGAAAVVILLISLYLTEGSFSLNSVLGISDSYDESIICLFTGN